MKQWISPDTEKYLGVGMQLAASVLLGFFAGFLLYIGASDILPEAHSKYSSWKTVLLTVLGAALICLITRVR